MKLKLSDLRSDISLHSKLVNYRTENIYDVLLFTDGYDIYINDDLIRILSYTQSTNSKTKVLCEVSKNSKDNFDKKIYKDLISGILNNDKGAIINSTKNWIIEALSSSNIILID